MIPEALIDAFEQGFLSCQSQIVRKFPKHSVDFKQLDACESEDDEDNDTEEEADE